MMAAILPFFSPAPISPIFVDTKNLINAGNKKSIGVACEATKISLDGLAYKVEHCKDYQGKVDDIKRLLKPNESQDTMESLMVVDALQRLGVVRHYQEEIHAILNLHYLRNCDTIRGCCSLHDAALSFRLLRQGGYTVSADVFNGFRGRDGKFEGDVKGLLELYEAAQLRFEGENILDDAEDFSSRFLHQSLADNHHNGWNIVNQRLRRPYHRSITGLMENEWIRDLECAHGWAKTLTEFAEMEFVNGQAVHKQELLQVSEWWDDLGLTRELKLVRNQPLKWYTWSMASLIHDVGLSAQRVQLTKSIALVYLIDDIFDLYGTPQELAVFTEAVYKWDYAAMEMLPDYMKMSYKALVDTTNEIGHMIRGMHGHNPIDSLKQTWGSLCTAFLVEAEWLASNNLPSAREYLANAKVSSGVHVVLVHLFFLLGLNPNHVNDASGLTSCVAGILRLWDDLGSAKDEHQYGRDGSYVECYMSENQGSSLKEARKHVREMISLEWKRLNKECSSSHLNNSSPGLCFREASLNLARMVSLMYDYDDNQRLRSLDRYISFMLLNQPSSEQNQPEKQLR